MYTKEEDISFITFILIESINYDITKIYINSYNTIYVMIGGVIVKLENKNIGYVFTGSFCTFKRSIDALKELIEEKANIIPIMSYNAYNLDTKFGKARDFIDEIENLCNKRIIHTIQEAEPIGPKELTDIMIIAPSSGNTMAKLACDIIDTPALMAAKSHLRNNRPLVIAPSTNNGLRK